MTGWLIFGLAFLAALVYFYAIYRLIVWAIACVVRRLQARRDNHPPKFGR